MKITGMAAEAWQHDPKHLGFTLARYKFVARMFEGKHHVLEIGAGDGWFSRVVHQHVAKLTLIDKNASDPLTYPCVTKHDMVNGPISGRFDAAYALDVIEHIAPCDTFMFLANIEASVDGPVIIGTPSLESQQYASEASRAEHINCISGDVLRASMQLHWGEVFMFGMNDEVLHTGHYGMCHYLLALAC